MRDILWRWWRESPLRDFLVGLLCVAAIFGAVAYLWIGIGVHPVLLILWAVSFYLVLRPVWSRLRER